MNRSFHGAQVTQKRRRRHRTIFTEEQLETLEQIFKSKTQYPDVIQREELSKKLNLKEERVEVSNVISRVIYLLFVKLSIVLLLILDMLVL